MGGQEGAEGVGPGLAGLAKEAAAAEGAVRLRTGLGKAGLGLGVIVEFLNVVQEETTGKHNCTSCTKGRMATEIWPYSTVGLTDFLPRR